MVKALLGRKRAEGLSEETVAKIRRHVHAMFAFAQDAGLVTINPASAPRKRGQKQRRRARGTALTPAQIARFLKECSPRWRLFFTVALDSGLRRGELVGLRWEDVDLLDRILYVRRSIGNYDDPADMGDDEEGGTLTTTRRSRMRLGRARTSCSWLRSRGTPRPRPPWMSTVTYCRSGRTRRLAGCALFHTSDWQASSAEEVLS